MLYDLPPTCLLWYYAPVAGTAIQWVCQSLFSAGACPFCGMLTAWFGPALYFLGQQDSVGHLVCHSCDSIPTVLALLCPVLLLPMLPLCCSFGQSLFLWRNLAVHPISHNKVPSLTETQRGQKCTIHDRGFSQAVHVVTGYVHCITINCCVVVALQTDIG